MPNTSPPRPIVNNPIKDLILLFAVPIVILAIAAGLIYIPRLLAHPAYDFIYAVCDQYSCRNSYMVDSSGRLSEEVDPGVAQSRSYDRPAQLRYYDASSGVTRSITPDEARGYRLDTSSRSPDGYTLTHESSSGGFLFWSDRSDGWYLKNGAKKKEVELTAGQSFYSRNVEFLGWVRA